MFSQEEIQRWDEGVAYVRQILIEVLEDLGHVELVKYLPWGKGSAVEAYVESELDERAIQVLSLCFSLLNMVEENVANQMRRIQSHSEERLWTNVFSEARQRNISCTSLSSISEKLMISPVLTAHPTEAKRATTLEQYRQLYLLLIKKENSMWSEEERDLLKNEVKSIIEIILRTGDVYLDRPSVDDELRNISHYLTSVFPDAIRMLYRRFAYAYAREYGDTEKVPHFPSLIFGTWVGGDRDGHPFVTHETTKKTLSFLRTHAIDLVRKSITRITIRLSLNDRLQDVPDVLIKRMREIEEELGAQSIDPIKRNPGEPWRQYLNLLLKKLPDENLSSPCYLYRSYVELLNDLEILCVSLRSVRAAHVSIQEVEPEIAVIRSVGFHLARLDIRQNSDFYEKAVSQILFQAGVVQDESEYGLLREEARIALLEKELKSKRPLVREADSVGKEADEARATFRVIRDHISLHGAGGVGSLIISMTRSVSDLLTVHLLAKESGFSKIIDGFHVAAIPVVPLFETISDLKQSEEIMRKYFSRYSSKDINDHSLHSPIQEVMIGYSDSSKDGGILSSYWNLYTTQQKLLLLGKEYEREFVFFHGRGGTVTRGAGPTGRFLSALPPGTISRGLKMTEQGETISQKYGNLLTCSYNLELLQAGTFAENIFLENDIVDSQAFSSIMEFLSEESFKKYQALIQDEQFVPFFREATPIDVLENSKIGSRPPKRSGSGRLEDLRAIPWVFSLNQSRFFLSSWYGVGTALRCVAQDSESWGMLRLMVTTWNPARYIFTNIESSIYSADREIMGMYSELVKDERVRKQISSMIFDECALTKDLLSRLFDSKFEDRRKRLYKTLSMRNETLRILHMSQIGLLKKWRSSKENRDELLNRLLLVTNAIAGGLRTTG